MIDHAFHAISKEIVVPNVNILSSIKTLMLIKKTWWF